MLIRLAIKCNAIYYSTTLVATVVLLLNVLYGFYWHDIHLGSCYKSNSDFSYAAEIYDHKSVAISYGAIYRDMNQCCLLMHMCLTVKHN